MSMSYALEMTAELNEHITSVQGFMSSTFPHSGTHTYTHAQAYNRCAITITIAIATDIEYI